jgi:flavin-dependent dehydrogenase
VISRGEVRVADALREFPELQNRLAKAKAVSAERGGLSISRKLPNVCDHSVALIGDASGSVDAITGEGLSVGFSQSVALAQALRSGNLEEYRRDHAAIMRRPRAMQAILLGLDLSREIQRRSLRALEAHPDVFASLLRAHVGTSSLMDVCSIDLCRKLRNNLPFYRSFFIGGKNPGDLQ